MSIRKLFITLVALSALFACEKYKEGPNISLKSEEARLARKWQVQTAHYSLFSDNPTAGDDQTYIWQNLKIEIKKDKSYSLENFNIALTEKTIETGTWEFTEDLLMLKTSGTAKRYNVETDNLLSEGGKNSTWRITRLTKKDWWVWYQNQVDPPWVYFKMKAFK
ncbi:MAG: hypothetical protein GQ574_03665 [Crocinitomix sp.]|nr:hypothetical protein [Crocinitomix sp.]